MLRLRLALNSTRAKASTVPLPGKPAQPRSSLVSVNVLTMFPDIQTTTVPSSHSVPHHTVIYSENIGHTHVSGMGERDEQGESLLLRL